MRTWYDEYGEGEPLALLLGYRRLGSVHDADDTLEDALGRVRESLRVNPADAALWYSRKAAASR